MRRVHDGASANLAGLKFFFGLLAFSDVLECNPNATIGKWKGRDGKNSFRNEFISVAYFAKIVWLARANNLHRDFRKVRLEQGRGYIHQELANQIICQDSLHSADFDDRRIGG